MKPLQPRDARILGLPASLERQANASDNLLGPLVGGPLAFIADHRGRLKACNDAYAKLAASFDPPLPTAVGASITVPHAVLGRLVAGGPSVGHDWLHKQGSQPRSLRFELWCLASGAE